MAYVNPRGSEGYGIEFNEANRGDWGEGPTRDVLAVLERFVADLGRNSMGKLKFNFANPEGIYLHDTPNKVLFAQSNRALSNGCIRLEDAKRLCLWLMGREPVGDRPGLPVGVLPLGAGGIGVPQRVWRLLMTAVRAPRPCVRA